MPDMIFLAVGLGFFVACAGAIRVCAALMRPRN
jgi:hypothetical protein